MAYMRVSKNNLPAGWRWGKLGDVCEPKTNTRDPRLNQDSEFIYIDITSINSARKSIVEPKTLLGKDAPSRARQVVQVGDIIVSTTRPNLNAVAKITSDFDGQICSTGFCVLRPIPQEIDSTFLYFFVQSSEFVKGLSDLVKGALYPAVTDKDVRAIGIPLPPMDEQKRIAARLDGQMRRIEQARQAAEESLYVAWELPSAYLNDIFNGHKAKNWSKIKLGEICEVTARQVDPKIPEYGALPHINGENIESGTGKLLHLNTAAEDGMTSGKYLFEAGDILYSKLRPYLRKVYLPDFRGVCSADMYPIKVNREKLQSQFLVWLLISDGFTKYADEESRRARMPKLNREQLFAFEAPLPSIEEQKQISKWLDQKIPECNQLQQSLESQLAEINELPSALLRQAFAGEL